MKTKEQKLIELANEALNSNDVCSEWKSKINKALGNELEIGKWYENGNILFNFNGKYDEQYYPCGYGFSGFGSWIDDDQICGWGKKNLKLATEKEVEEALIKEAKKRGVWNVPIVSATGNINTKNIFTMGFNFTKNRLWSEYGRVFYNGKWATPIEEEIIEVNGIKYKRCD